MSIRKLRSILNVFKKGEIVANPEAWKKGQITTNVLGGFLLAVLELAPLVGIPLPPGLTASTITGISAGVLAIVNTALTVTTTKKIGVH